MNYKSFFIKEFLLATATASDYLENIDQLILFLKKNSSINKDIVEHIETICAHSNLFFAVSPIILNSQDFELVINKRIELFNALKFREYASDLQLQFINSLIQQIDFNNNQHLRALTHTIEHDAYSKLFLTHISVRVFFRHIFYLNGCMFNSQNNTVLNNFLHYLFNHIKAKQFNNHLSDPFILAPIFNLDKDLYGQYKKWANVSIRESQYVDMIKALCYDLGGSKFISSKVTKWQKYERINFSQIQKILTQDTSFNKKNQSSINKYIAQYEKSLIGPKIKSVIKPKIIYKI